MNDIEICEWQESRYKISSKTVCLCIILRVCDKDMLFEVSLRSSFLCLEVRKALQPLL